MGIPSTAAPIVVHTLEMDTISTLPTTLHQTPNHSQALDTPTAHHLETAMNPPSRDHSWRVVSTSDLTKSKSSMKLPEKKYTELEFLALQTLLNKPNKLLQIYTTVV